MATISLFYKMANDPMLWLYTEYTNWLSCPKLGIVPITGVLKRPCKASLPYRAYKWNGPMINRILWSSTDISDPIEPYSEYSLLHPFILGLCFFFFFARFWCDSCRCHVMARGSFFRKEYAARSQFTEENEDKPLSWRLLFCGFSIRHDAFICYQSRPMLEA